MNSQTDRITTIVAFVAALLCLLLTVVRARPPAPREPTTEGSFSAVSAQAVLEDLYATGVTHPIGTENNRLLKEQILDHLRKIGYEPTVQSTMACWDSGGCGHVENILARLEGKGTGKAVLLAVHYDGVGAGPSVSDDGVAVAATLEIARILKSGPQLENDVIFLIDDGEEAFLLGAVAFAAKHPWAQDVGAVVNLEARGSSGRSYMFETGTNNAWLIDLMKRNVPRPATSSLFYSIYQRLPNDTDFTVFKHYGMNGVNFAFIGDVAHYHTPLDDLVHVTSATLQHQGENALGMVRALAETDLDSPPTGTSSWFDVWGFGILSWPETWNLPLAILSLSARGARVRGRLAPRRAFESPDLERSGALPCHASWSHPARFDRRLGSLLPRQVARLACRRLGAQGRVLVDRHRYRLAGDLDHGSQNGGSRHLAGIPLLARDLGRPGLGGASRCHVSLSGSGLGRWRS